MEDDSFDVHRLQDPMPSVITSYGPSHRRISSTKQCPTQRPVQASLEWDLDTNRTRKSNPVQSTRKRHQRSTPPAAPAAMSRFKESKIVPLPAQTVGLLVSVCGTAEEQIHTKNRRHAKLCGVRQVHVYKTGEIIHSRVDPSKIK